MEDGEVGDGAGEDAAAVEMAADVAVEPDEPVTSPRHVCSNHATGGDRRMGSPALTGGATVAVNADAAAAGSPSLLPLSCPSRCPS